MLRRGPSKETFAALAKSGDGPIHGLRYSVVKRQLCLRSQLSRTCQARKEILQLCEVLKCVLHALRYFHNRTLPDGSRESRTRRHCDDRTSLC